MRLEGQKHPSLLVSRVVDDSMEFFKERTRTSFYLFEYLFEYLTK